MTTTWLVRCGDGGRYVDEAVRDGIITVDFREASDVTGLPVEEIAVQLASSKARTATSRLAEMLFAFANEIEEGDAVICSDRARRQVVIGRITGPYEWVEDPPANQQHHTRKIEWSARWGWDDLPETVRNTVLHYQRTVLKFPDQETALMLTEKAEASGLPAVYTAPAAEVVLVVDRPPARGREPQRTAVHVVLHHPAPLGVPRGLRDLPGLRVARAAASRYPGSPANGLSRHASPALRLSCSILRRRIRQAGRRSGSRSARRVGRRARVTRTPRAGS